MTDDKPLGGMNCQCSNYSQCGEHRAALGRFLGVPIDMRNFATKGRGKGGKGRGKGGKGKHKHKCTSKGSGWWEPR